MFARLIDVNNPRDLKAAVQVARTPAGAAGHRRGDVPDQATHQTLNDPQQERC
jgi:hypothetical protein